MIFITFPIKFFINRPNFILFIEKMNWSVNEKETKKESRIDRMI
jgi:hypothetical protein